MFDLGQALAFYLVFVLSTTIHEAAHAWTAKLGGDLTAYRGGQVSIDPLPHMRREPFGMVVLPLLSTLLFHWPFGYASAPYDPLWARSHPRRAAFMALAGPLSNLALAMLAAVAMRFACETGLLAPPEAVGFAMVVDGGGSSAGNALAMFLGMFFSMNLLLFVLNLIPLPPLDGSSAITLLMPRETALRFSEFIENPLLAVCGIFIAWKLLDVVFHPIFFFAVNVLYFPLIAYGD